MTDSSRDVLYIVNSRSILIKILINSGMFHLFRVFHARVQGNT